METLFGWLVIIGLIWIVYGGGLGKIFGAGKAAIDTAQGKGTFKDNLGVQLNGMGPLEFRATEKDVGEPGKSFRVIEFEVKGLLPVLVRKKKCAFVTSVLDGTEENWSPVVSAISDFQEKQSTCYQNRVEIGEVPPNVGYPRWVKAGIVLKDVLQPPRRGQRKLQAVLRLVDIDEPTSIQHGFGSTDAKDILWAKIFAFDANFPDKGWLDEQEGSRSAKKATLQLGVLVAIKDGVLDEHAGRILKEWMIKSLSAYSDDARERWKTELNAAFKMAFEGGKAGSVTVSALTSVLMGDGDKRTRMSAIDLMYEIIGAGGKVGAKELALVRRIAEALEIDPADVQRIADQKLISVTTDISSEAELEDLLDIDRTWDQETIKKHLRTEFQKWNNRINALTDDNERANAQRMLDLIAQARKKYSR